MNSANEFIQKIKEKASIVEVVGEYVRLKKSGANHMGLCPFHAERSPSFSVVEKKGIYHCFGCQKGGDVISFIQEIQGISFPDALRALAHKFSIPLTPELRQRREGTPGRQEAGESDVLYKLNRFVAQFYHAQLMGASGERARQYLLGRGIREETMRDHYIGYAPDSWQSLVDFLEAKKAPLAKADLLGLIRPRSNAQPGERSHYDVFRDRIIFPVVDLKGRVVAFGGRSLTDGAGPKYLNSPETPVFKKSSTLYGIFRAQKDIRADDLAVVVEGYMDCLALHQAGVPGAVATLGTALTVSQVQMLKRYTQNVVLLFDGDSAGQEAQSRAMETFLKCDLVARGVGLPDGLDPDDFVRARGGDALKALLSDAPYLLDVKILDLAAGAGSHAEGRSRALQQALPWVAQIGSQTSRMVRVQQLAGLFGLEAKAIERSVDEIRRSRPAEKTTASQPSRVSSRPQPRLDPLDVKLVEFLAAYPALRRSVQQPEAVLMGLESEHTLEFAKVVFDESGARDLDQIILELADTNSLKSVITGALATAAQEAVQTPREDLEREFKDLNLRLIRRGLEKRREQLRARIMKADSGGAKAEVAQLMTEYSELARQLEKSIEKPSP
jgi:DNA primase